MSIRPADSHLVHLQNGWSCWKAVCLRGAGFPAATALELGTPDVARASDRVIESEVDAVASEGPRADLSLTFERERVRVGEALRRIARDPRFREAWAWQNRRVIREGIEPLLRHPATDTGTKTRQKELLVASYVQRYCLKNDTIGFFGPVGWGSLSEDDDIVRMRPGPSLLAKRTVYFEPWCIVTLAEVLAEDPELREHLAPRLISSMRVEEDQLHYPDGRSLELPPEYSALLRACDGTRSAKDIARALLSEPELELEGEADVFELLDQLSEKKILSLGLTPPADLHPERPLRRTIERMSESPSQVRALGAVAELEASRDAIARSAGSAEALDGSIAALEETFERVTARASVRRGGKTYAGRTLMFEDCRRDIELELGKRFLARLGPALELLLVSARWYTFTLAQRFRRLFEDAYHANAAETGSRVVDYFKMWQRIEPHLSGNAYQAATSIVRDIGDDLRRRWMEILQIPAGVPRFEVSSASIRERVLASFDAPHPGWPGARHHSPDLQIAAKSAEAFARGEYSIVLGELHPGVNTCMGQIFFGQHPSPDTLVEAMVRDIAEPRVWSVIPKEQRMRVGTISSFVPGDYDIELGETPSWRPPEQVLKVAELVFEEIDGHLVVRTRDGRKSFDVISFFGNNLRVESVGHFSIMPTLPHAPRVSVDGVVISRERWRFEPADLAFAKEDTLVGRFVEARRWARRHELPRFVFVRIPEEIKPCYVDLESTIFVESFAKLVRKASSVSMSEMLPAVDETWLADAEGRTYTSELRMVAVDPIPWKAPA